MANIPATTMQFKSKPGKVYTFLQDDKTLTVDGAAADAKATGDKIGELKSAFDNTAVVCKSRLSNISALSEVLIPGVYGVPGDIYNACTDKPDGASHGVKTLIVYTKTYSNHIIQILIDIYLYKYERILNADGSTYRDWVPKTDTTLMKSGIPADASVVGSRFANNERLISETAGSVSGVFNQLNDFPFYRPNPANILQNPVFYSIEESANELRRFRLSGNVVALSEDDVPNGYGKGVAASSGDNAFDYLLPLSDIETGDYTVSVLRFGAASYNGRFMYYYVDYENGGYTVYGDMQQTSPSSLSNPSWTVSINKEEIQSTYPDVNALLLRWNNTSLVTSYYACPMMYKTTTEAEPFLAYNKYYAPVREAFEPGRYAQQTIINESTDGYYSYAGTNLTEYGRVKTSTLISVTSQYIKFTGSAWANVPALVYFDSNQTKIGCYPAAKPEPLYVNYVDEVVEIPSNVAYIRIQDVHGKQSGTLAPELYFSMGLVAKEANHALIADAVTGTVYPTTDILYGKKLVTAGDSYTHASFPDTEYNLKNYGYYVAQRHNMTFINSGISGSIMALDKDYVADPEHVDINTRRPFSYQRYLQVPEDADYLTIWFGINDNAHTNLGTIDDETNETFYGAWNTVLRYYLTNRPFLKIGLIVTIGASEPYRQAVRDVAEKWGYPYLDWVNDKSIPAFFDRTGMSTEARALRRKAYGYDDYSAHPSPQWHQYASTIYENFLRSL